MCAADDAEARLSVGSWLLLTCDEIRCECESPATLVLLLLFLGTDRLDGFPCLAPTQVRLFEYLADRAAAPVDYTQLTSPRHPHPHTPEALDQVQGGDA